MDSLITKYYCSNRLTALYLQWFCKVWIFFKENYCNYRLRDEHLKCACNHCAKFEICWPKTVAVNDYTNVVPSTECDDKNL